MNYLEQYKILSKEWFYLKRDPDATKMELSKLNDQINELWKQLSPAEQFDANNYVATIKRF